MITNSFSETEKIGENLARKVKDGGVIALYGELGSGKTTFVKGLARGLGIEKRIVSPTFIFIREYKVPRRKARAKGVFPKGCPKRSPSSEVGFDSSDGGTERRGSKFKVEEPAKLLYHIDLYRIDEPEAARALGLEEILSDPQNIVALEWAEKIKKILPKKRIDIRFKYINENKREIVFKNRA